MSFVKRNENDLLDTLLDINDTIHREYHLPAGHDEREHDRVRRLRQSPRRLPGLTNLMTCSRACSGVPARYVCGYILYGAQARQPAPEQASHAWVQVTCRSRLEGLRLRRTASSRRPSTCACGRPQLPRRDADERHDLRRRWREILSST